MISLGSAVPPLTSRMGLLTVFSDLRPPIIDSKLQLLPSASKGLAM